MSTSKHIIDEKIFFTLWFNHTPAKPLDSGCRMVVYGLPSNLDIKGSKLARVLANFFRLSFFIFFIIMLTTQYLILQTGARIQLIVRNTALYKIIGNNVHESFKIAFYLCLLYLKNYNMVNSEHLFIRLIYKQSVRNELTVTTLTTLPVRSWSNSILGDKIKFIISHMAPELLEEKCVRIFLFASYLLCSELPIIQLKSRCAFFDCEKCIPSRAPPPPNPPHHTTSHIQHNH